MKLILVTLAHDHDGTKSMSVGKMWETDEQGRDMDRIKVWLLEKVGECKCVQDRDSCMVNISRVPADETSRSPLACAAEDIP